MNLVARRKLVPVPLASSPPLRHIKCEQRVCFAKNVISISPPMCVRKGCTKIVSSCSLRKHKIFRHKLRGCMLCQYALGCTSAASPAHGINSPTRLSTSTVQRKNGSRGRLRVSTRPLIRPYLSDQMRSIAQVGVCAPCSGATCQVGTCLCAVVRISSVIETRTMRPEPDESSFAKTGCSITYHSVFQP